jgi:SAM-dependent methyltransferase
MTDLTSPAPAATTATTTPPAQSAGPDAELTARHRAMWALGDYPAVADRVVSTMGPELVAACGIGAGQRVLDVAAGSGNTAIPAALTGADVVASDLTPELLEAGRARAAARGATLTWREADCEALPFGDDSFDTVVSSLGVIFAPHHQRAADELVRVCRPGGTIGVVSWTAQGFIGELLATMKPYAAPPPPGAQPAPLWGDPEHVARLLGDRADVLTAERRLLRVDCFDSPGAFRDFFRACYGPTVATYRRIADDPGQVAALDRDLAALAARHDRGTDGRTVMDWEYLLVVARRR